MAFDPNITNMEHYTKEMVKPLLDKMFFVDKVDPETQIFVDYGCADGIMAAPLQMFMPGTTYVGYDISESMVQQARAKNPGVIFTSNWQEVKDILVEARLQERKTAVVLNSLIHEVYAYLNPQEIQEFWTRVWGGATEPGFDTVCIRDMMVNQSTSRLADTLSVTRVRQLFSADKVRQWEQQWGTLNENWSLVHFLLTYRYEDNWEREFRENYFPMSLEAFINTVPRRFVAAYQEHFVPPFMRRIVKKDFGILMQDATHLKIIFERE